MRHQPTRFSNDRVRLGSIVGAVLIIALAISVIVTASRYDRALGAADDVSQRRAEALVTQETVTAFWNAREAMNAYLIVPSPQLLAEVREVSATLNRHVADAARVSTHGDERTLVTRARTGSREFTRAFERVRAAAGTTGAAEGKAMEQLNAGEEEVLAPLSSLQRLTTAEAAEAQAASESAATDAHLAAKVTAVVGILLALFIALTLIVIRRLLASIRATAEVLGASVDELRASSRDSAAAAGEQSAAVAETSATIEELAVTARSISDNARVVADAAEQTGDTMRDMQEKVDAIAERSFRWVSVRRRSARSWS